MHKKTKILFVSMILLICIPVALAFGQNKPAAFKQTTIKAPEFSLKDLQGKTFKLRSQLGKPVVIFFGTTWCPACRAEIPSYKNIYTTYAKQGLQVLYIDINEPAEKVARFAKSNSLPYLVLLDSDGSAANSYNIVGVPTLVLIDKKGNLVTICNRSSDLPLDKIFPAKK